MSAALPLPSSERQAPELPEGRKVGVIGKTEAGESTVAPRARDWTWRRLRLAYPQKQGKDKHWSEQEGTAELGEVKRSEQSDRKPVVVCTWGHCCGHSCL